jgi:7-cyano-7-deazaguanine synthase
MVRYWPLEEAEDTPAKRHAVAIVSGGLDSVTMAYVLHAAGWQLTLLSFDYGQRHRRELACAEATARRLQVPHHLVDIAKVGGLLCGSALTDQAVAVPVGRYTDQSLRVTVVPNRNMILLAIATGMTIAHGATAVAFGAHAGKHPIYPDCGPDFVEGFHALAKVANRGFLPAEFQILAPFLRHSKADIVRLGAQLAVPYDQTWSCYVGGEMHCGRCGTCTERRESFLLAGVSDPTRYST